MGQTRCKQYICAKPSTVCTSKNTAFPFYSRLLSETSSASIVVSIQGVKTKTMPPLIGIYSYITAFNIFYTGNQYPSGISNRKNPNTNVASMVAMETNLLIFFRFCKHLRVQTHIVIKKKFIFSYNDLDIQVHIIFFVIICLNYLIICIL